MVGNEFVKTSFIKEMIKFGFESNLEEKDAIVSLKLSVIYGFNNEDKKMG
jgi:hypothetical protein